MSGMYDTKRKIRYLLVLLIMPVLELAYLQRIFEEFYNGNYEFLADDYGEKILS